MANFNMIITLLGGLSFFLMGMITMSDALQKVAGTKMRSLLAAMTGNRFLGIFTGFLVTAIVQSSSATTVMLVSFVNAGLMNLTQSIGVILGANIGTTVTGWMVSLLGFKVKIAYFSLPSITLGFFAKFSKKEKVNSWGEVLLGFGLLFFGLTMMKGAIKTPENLAMVKLWMSNLHATGVFTRLIAIGAGALATIIIQSSSAVMALTLILAFQGLIDFETGIALILGQNIGTTITANLAALGAKKEAVRAARAHLVFNVLGVLIVMLSWPLWIKSTDWVVPSSSLISKNLPIHLSAFHTAFNIINTIIFIPFVGLLAKIATRMVPDSKIAAKEELKYLQYIDYGLIPTPQLALLAARQDLGLMADLVIEMIRNVRKLSKASKKPKGNLVSKILRMEEKSDKMAAGIVDYLSHISHSSLSYQSSHEIAAMMHTVSDYERMGDHCEQLTKLLRKKYEKKYKFSEEAQEELDELISKVEEFVIYTRRHLLEHSDILEKSYDMENKINQLSKIFRKKNIERMSNNTCMVQGGLIFINMIVSLEKIGDHNVNVSEEISGVR
ncbi:MAG: Na/Pi cotransporter family protein [Myxococcota bacterium]